MLNIELVRFQAQDVITASAPCPHTNKVEMTFEFLGKTQTDIFCGDCGVTLEKDV